MLQITYDIYRPLLAPKAGGQHLLLVSRIMVAGFGLVMAVVSVIFYKAYRSSFQCSILPMKRNTMIGVLSIAEML